MIMQASAARIRYIASWLAWPVIFGGAMTITGIGFAYDQPIIGFNIGYLFLGLSLFVLERLMPHEASWNKDDGQTWASIAHTLTSKGTVQAIFLFSTVIGLTNYITPADQPGYGIWPREWPMAVQAAMGIVAAEFALYWGHRIAHTWPPMWQFHAVHHSVTRLWVLNTGRFHFVDSLKSILGGMAVLMLLGAPMEVFQWLAAVTAFIGMLTHCNVEMRFGPISYIFNTPELHRWHHSRDLREGDKNFGENVVIWDLLFCSYFREETRRPPENIGIPQYMPPGFWAQLAFPFKRLFKRQLKTVYPPGYQPIDYKALERAARDQKKAARASQAAAE